MAEYIEREAAIEEAIDAVDEWSGGYNPHRAAMIRDGINTIPTADVAPVHHAKDIYYKGDGHCEFKCSLCGVEIGVVEGGELDGGYFRYCPGCGAKMDAEVNE